MLNLLFVLGIVLFQVSSKSVCDKEQQEILKDNGVSRAKQEELIDLINMHRNNVALGRQKNWEDKLQTSSQMNYLKWDHTLAHKAQQCANVCPQRVLIDCSQIIGQHHGVIFFQGDVWNGGADWHVNQVISSWRYNKDMSRQLEMGDAMHFGCGRGQVERKRISSETIVCVFDRKVKMHGPPYKEGMPGQKCPYNLKKGYLGLCRHNQMDMNVISHHINHKRVHHRSD